MGCTSSVAHDGADGILRHSTTGETSAKASVAPKSTSSESCSLTTEDIYKAEDLWSKPIIDEELALEQVSDDTELLRHFHAMLHEQFDNNFSELQAGYKKSDYVMLWKAAHCLKGATCNLGVNRFAHICKVVQQYGQDMDALVKSGKILTKEQTYKCEVFIQLMAIEWEEYRKYYKEFLERLARFQAVNG